MKRYALEPAYLLDIRPYRETSALLEAFTQEHGRIGLVARGVRAPKSKLRGQLQPFRRLLLSWLDRGELGTLTAVECDGPVRAISGETVFLGWYVNELVLRLLPRRDAHPQLFRDFAETLAGLDGARSHAALRIFEKRLLSQLGYGLSLPPRVDAEAWYEFDTDSRLCEIREPTPRGFRGSSLQALAAETLESEPALRDARRLLRTALEQHLGGRELATPRLLRSLRRARKPGRVPHA